MLGYVTCETGELKVKDNARYGAYYCGVCQSIAGRYGQMPRLLLSYDAAFLAVLLGGITDEATLIERRRCLTHALKKKPVAASPAVDYAADMMMLLAGCKAEDDVHDRGGFRARFIRTAVHPFFRKAKAAHPKAAARIETELAALSALEAASCDSLDETGMAFGRVMGTVFTGYEPAAASRRILENMGMHLGRWIYLIDAWEDMEEDLDEGSYNPLLYRFDYQAGESKENFRQRIHNAVQENMMQYLAQLAKASDLLDTHANRPIIDNVIYMGLLRRTEDSLAKGRKTHHERKKEREHDGESV